MSLPWSCGKDKKGKWDSFALAVDDNDDGEERMLLTRVGIFELRYV